MTGFLKECGWKQSIAHTLVAHRLRPLSEYDAEFLSMHLLILCGCPGSYR